MTITPAAKNPRKPALRRWIRRAFLLWAVISTAYIANSFRTRGLPAGTLQSSQTVSVVDGATTLEFTPITTERKAALIFICGGGVSAHAYGPLLRPLAEVGHPVFIVKLPYRLAPLEPHKQAAVDRARNVIAAHPHISHWVLSGHSLGGALACRVAQSDSAALSALVLIGTTHPKHDDLSSLPLPVTKIYASSDGVAPPDRVLSNKRLLPSNTHWVEIKGGNHSQFGHYGHQLFDGQATITREAQQSATRSALLDVLTNVAR